MATAVGALPIFAVRSLSQRLQDGLLGFAAGVMLSATFFSLVRPALEEAERRFGHVGIAAVVVATGMLIGAVGLFLAHRYAPHEHFVKGKEGKGVSASKLARIWLFVIAITLHNFPEGLAVGVGYGGGNVANGNAVALGIGLQNMPEGFVVALAVLAAQHYTRTQAFLVALASGLVEPIAGIFGAVAVALSEPLLPWALAFAGGAMLFVISGEIIPETHGAGHETIATFALMLGFVAMMLLDATL
jgi:ZIP family zinc transporter